MEKFVEVTLFEKIVTSADMAGCPDGCQRAKGSPNGG